MVKVNRDGSQNLVSLLKARARKEAIWGVYIAVFCILIASGAICLLDEKTLSLMGLFNAHKNNASLLILDSFAFIFPLWGQYSSQIMAYEANEIFREYSDDLEDRNEQLEKEKLFVSTHDPITELPNKSLFIDRLDTVLKLATAAKRFQAIFYLQVNNYKEIADTLGPTWADVVIKQFGVRLVRGLGGLDTVARVESNVFGVIDVSSQDEAQNREVINRVQKAIEHPFEINGMKISLNVQYGVAFFPQHATEVNSMIQKVGIATYMANNSHNGFAIYSPEFDESSPKGLTLMGDLLLALEENQFELHYQPKIDLVHESVQGVEALVRWRHAKHGLMSPGDFISMVENSQHIKLFTQWVIDQAFTAGGRWHNEGIRISVSINLSPKDLLDPELPDRIMGSMARLNIDPKMFIFEITEGSLITDPVKTLGVLNRIHGLGFGISIDDFGTGFSSLSYLKRLPVSEIKIDKSFVIDMQTNESDAVIVKATIDLAHNLGLKVTAEGIESEQVLGQLKRLGCDYIQGFHISRGLPEKEFRSWLTTTTWKVGPTNGRQRVA